MQLSLPWPPRNLSPNARVHWTVLAKEKKAYRHTCFFLAKSAGAHKTGEDKVTMHFAFAPPDDKRRRDIDNLIASMKSGIDGLSDALQIDDSKFILSFEMIAPLGKVGDVTVTISWQL